MKALVTGATGFAGGHLCRVLTDAGHQVVALARESSDTSRLDSRRVSVRAGDICQPESLLPAMEGIDVVFHLAAAFRQAGLPESVFRAVNVEGTGHVIRCAATAGVSRVVHCSTIGVLGDTGAIPADETRPIGEASDSYNRTKIEGERLALGLFEEFGIEGVVARPGAGYGPGELRYLKLFRGIAKRRFLVFGSGETLFNLGYIDDLAAGLVLCGTHPNAAGEIFHLGGSENVPLNRLAELVSRAVGRDRHTVPHFPVAPVVFAARLVEAVCRPFGVEPPLHRRRVEFFTVNRAIDTEKAQKILDYRPRTSLERGLALAAEWYRSEGLLEAAPSG